MSTILFYSPFNQRSRDTESLMIAFREQGHRVISLSQQEGFVINDFLRSRDIEAFSYVLHGQRSGWWYYLRHLVYFIYFCWRHNVDIVYSHLEPANFVASVGQYFIRARTFLCRHHIDEGNLYSFDKDLYYKITYALARKIIVVSDHARQYMIKYEKIPAKKIIHLDLAYNFELYGEINKVQAQIIRTNNPAEILLLSACRLTAFKRPEAVLHTTKKLIDAGLDVRLIMLGKGEMLGEIEKLISELNLTGRVLLPGYVSNVLDYMAAADFFIHPSILDSSCVAVKEAGLALTPVVVCRGVGDFDDYIIHGQNGFFVEKDKFAEDAFRIIKDHYMQRELLKHIGEQLNKSVLDRFSVENVIFRYYSLNYKSS
jgi:glycosyltransferase involved in cell wall biosynthesis